jgi:pilus assembly protein CpaE
VISVTIAGSQDRQLGELLKSAGMQVASIPESGLPALAGPAARQPDVLVLDVRRDGTVPSAIAEIRRQHVTTGVVIVASSLDPAMLLAAMRAGVNELVTDPVTQADLERAITRVLEQRPRTEVGQVFGFVGAKGGVGATTIAVNVATLLGAASQAGRALLIDMHYLGGDAAVFLGVEPRFSVVDALENTRRLDSTYFQGLVTRVSPGLDLLASSERTVAGQVDSSRIRAVIDFAATAYQYTVIDLPRSDSGVLDGLDRLSAIMIVANQDLATARSAGRMAATLRQRYGADRVAVVLSRSDRQADIGPGDIARASGCAVAHAFPSDYRNALRALNKGRPLALDNHNELSGSLRRFAFHLAGIHQPDQATAPRTGLIGRLAGSRRS